MPTSEIEYDMNNNILTLMSVSDVRLIKSNIDLSRNYHLIHLDNVEDLGDLINALEGYKHYNIYVDKPKSGMDYAYMLEYYKDEPSIMIDDHLYDECMTDDDYISKNLLTYANSSDEVMFIWGFDFNTISQLMPVKSQVFLITWEEIDLSKCNHIEYCEWSYV